MSGGSRFYFFSLLFFCRLGSEKKFHLVFICELGFENLSWTRFLYFTEVKTFGENLERFSELVFLLEVGAKICYETKGGMLMGLSPLKMRARSRVVNVQGTFFGDSSI